MSELSAGRPYPAAPPHSGPSAGVALASWNQRVGASLVDVLLLLPTLAGYILLPVTARPVIVAADASVHGGFSGLGLAGLGLGTLYALLVGLWQLHRQGTAGQSFGMQAVGIRLVREFDGEAVGFDLALIRSLAHVLEFGVGFLLPLRDDKRQTVADKLCRTLVVVDR